MAGDWIKFEISTSDKPEVWQIADNLNIDPDAVVGKLLRVWSWFDQQSENGNAPSVTKLLLNRTVGVANFCEAMISCGWLFEKNGVISVTDFDKHNGKSAKTRANAAKRASDFRKSNAESNGDSVTKSVRSALPKEEKRREDINNNKNIKKSSPQILFKTWLSDLKNDSIDPIPEQDSIFEYADDAGIPQDWLRAVWVEFAAEFSSRDVRKKDWRAHFRNFVRKNYYKLWWVDTGVYKLTSAGQQAVIAMQSRDRRKQNEI